MVDWLTVKYQFQIYYQLVWPASNITSENLSCQNPFPKIQWIIYLYTYFIPLYVIFSIYIYRRFALYCMATSIYRHACIQHNRMYCVWREKAAIKSKGKVNPPRGSPKRFRTMSDRETRNREKLFARVRDMWPTGPFFSRFFCVRLLFLFRLFLFFFIWQI